MEEGFLEYRMIDRLSIAFCALWIDSPPRHPIKLWGACRGTGARESSIEGRVAFCFPDNPESAEAANPLENTLRRQTGFDRSGRTSLGFASSRGASVCRQTISGGVRKSSTSIEAPTLVVRLVEWDRLALVPGVHLQVGDHVLKDQVRAVRAK